MNVFKYIIPIAIIVFSLSNVYLTNSHPDVTADNRLYISIGAAILSGVISYFLFRKNPDDEQDENNIKR